MSTEKKNIVSVLADIQQNLRAPKDLRNNFGGYNYRSAESILEAVKPSLAKHGAVITLSDDLINLGDRYYVRATATLSLGDEQTFATAFAREELDKRGMDSMQLTGATSSYARKYALNGLLAIDDTKDSDATNTHGKDAPTASNKAPQATKTTQATTTPKKTETKPVAAKTQPKKAEPTKLIDDKGELTPNNNFDAPKGDESKSGGDALRKQKALKFFGEYDAPVVIKYLIGVEKLRYSSVKDFVEKEDIETILSIAQRFKESQDGK